LSLAEGFAQSLSKDIDIPQRVEMFLKADAELISTKDTEFRFHSGVPS